MVFTPPVATYHTYAFQPSDKDTAKNQKKTAGSLSFHYASKLSRQKCKLNVTCRVNVEVLVPCLNHIFSWNCNEHRLLGKEG